MAVPKYDEMFNVLVESLRELGGSATVNELEQRVASKLDLSEEDLSVMQGPKGYRSKFGYNLAWTRTYLKAYGILDNSSRGIWVLTDRGQHTESLKPEEVKRYVKREFKSRKTIETGLEEGENPEDVKDSWQDSIIKQMLALTPSGFENLCQRILRESGFVEVEVTGRSGDGGVDGKGIVKLGGLLGFRVVFQCKRYNGTVSSHHIRDFRGGLEGRADKGLFITTGTYTRDAQQEAKREGATPIDLIDGRDLAERMKDLRLGVSVEAEEVIEVDEEWFGQFD